MIVLPNLIIWIMRGKDSDYSLTMQNRYAAVVQGVEPRNLNRVDTGSNHLCRSEWFDRLDTTLYKNIHLPFLYYTIVRSWF